MLARKPLQILLFGAELSRLGHLGFVGYAHLGEEHLTELACRVYIKRRLIGLATDFALQLLQFVV